MSFNIIYSKFEQFKFFEFFIILTPLPIAKSWLAHLRHWVVQVGGGVARAAGGAGVGAAVPRPGLGLREAGVHLGVSVGASGSLPQID